MAKSKSITRKKSIYSKLKDPVRPKWMRVIKLITVILFSIVLIMASAGIIIKYYRLISTHK